MGTTVRFLILLLNFFLLSVPSMATVSVMRHPSGTPVSVCQPSDTNSNCGGSSGGSGTINSGTLNIVPEYVGTNTLGPSSNVYIVGSNLGIGSSSPMATFAVQGNGVFSSTIGASNFSGTSSGTNTGDQTCATTSGCVTGAITNVGIGTTNTIAYWSTANSIGSLNTATYPSLTELSYVKDVTSAIQTQINGKQATGNYITALTGSDGTASGPGSVAFTLNSQWKGWVDGGTNVYVSTTTDNVGIGTITPNAATLEIVKNAAQAPLKISSVGTGSGDYLKVDSSGNIGIGTTTPAGALTVMKGNVGIGTWSPRVGLEIGSAGTLNNVSAYNDAYVQHNLEVDGSIYGDGSQLTNLPGGGWTDGGTNVYTSTTTDNVGIGTTSPSTTLEIVKQSSRDPLMVSSSATGDGDYLIVKSSGNVGVGTITPSNALSVNGGSSGSLGIDINNVGEGGIGGNDAYTVLLLHGDAADASTTFTDSSTSAHTQTANGDVQIDTAQSKFGVSSILFDGNGDYITSPDSEDWNFGSGDLTIDFWYRPNVNGQDMFYSQYTSNNQAMVLYRESDNKLHFYVYTNTATIAEYTVSWTPTVATWVHVALVRKGSVLGIALDGVWQGLGTLTAIGTSTIPNYTGSLTIGKDASFNSYYVDGWLDEYRVSKFARWDPSGANFTPPATAYTTIGNTVLVFKSVGNPLFTMGTNIANNFIVATTSLSTNPILSVVNAGNVGVGTIVPTSKLAVLGNVGIGADMYTTVNGGDNNGLVVQGNVGMGTWIPNSQLTINVSSQPGLRINDSGIADTSPALFTDANGNVGVGTSNASLNLLNIKGATAIGSYATTSSVPSNGLAVSGLVGIGTTLNSASTGLAVMNGNVGIGTWNPNSSLQVSGGTFTSGLITDNGSNVGIGSANPLFFLTVKKSDTTTYTGSNASLTRIAIYNSDSSTANSFESLGFVTGSSTAGNTLTIGQIDGITTIHTSGSSAGDMAFKTRTSNALNERMRIMASGNVGVGTNNPTSLLADAGNATIGSSYSPFAAPTNGLLVQGNTGIGTTTGTSLLTVGGGATFGSSGSYTTAVAPSDGLLIQGNVGIGTLSPSTKLEVSGGVRLTTNGHLTSSGTAPTVANNDCGTTSQGTITAGSTDLRGSVVVGTLTVTSCAVTFTNAFNTAPICVTQDDTNILSNKNSQTTTKLTITSTTSMSGDTVVWHCIE